MNEQKYKEIEKENVKRINELMDIRTSQFKEIYQHKWWEYLIDDELYKFLCQKLAEIKANNIYPDKIAITDEDIKLLILKLVSIKESKPLPEEK